MDTIIIYTSITGTTEYMAETIGKQLTDFGTKVEIKDAFDTCIEDFKHYNQILIGSYTWGDGELPDEILDLYEELTNVILKGKDAAVFGPGDSSYPHFAFAVDILEERLKSAGCKIILEGLKVDTAMEEEQDIRVKCEKFTRKLQEIQSAINM